MAYERSELPERPLFSRIFSGVGSYFILILAHAETLCSTHALLDRKIAFGYTVALVLRDGRRR